jgi:predicted transcriptional regulator YdeE
MADAIAMPKITELPEFKVVGLELVCQMDGSSDIPALWEKFSPMLDALPPNEGFYGVCLAVDGDPSRFRYLACVRVADGVAVPAGLVEARVPAAKYAVYPFKDKVQEMGKVFADIYNRRLAAAGLQPANGGMPCLECYPANCMDEATGEMMADLYVAVQ